MKLLNYAQFKKLGKLDRQYLIFYFLNSTCKKKQHNNSYKNLQSFTIDYTKTRNI